MLSMSPPPKVQTRPAQPATRSDQEGDICFQHLVLTAGICSGQGKSRDLSRGYSRPRGVLSLRGFGYLVDHTLYSERHCSSTFASIGEKKNLGRGAYGCSGPNISVHEKNCGEIEVIRRSPAYG